MDSKNVIPFHEGIEYKFCVEYCKYDRVYSNNEKIIVSHVLIMIERCKRGVTTRVPHPVSEYLLTSTKRNRDPRINSIRAKAMNIVPFLNFIIIDNQKKFKVRDIYDLKFEHAEYYLNYYSMQGVAKQTVITRENYLKDFYYYLAKKKILLHHTIEEFTIIVDKEKNKTIVESPFNNILYPVAKNSNIILHDLPNELIIPFIDTALDVAPLIALGVYFQFFGGLRIGEVVNIKRTGIRLKGPMGKYGLIVNIQPNNHRTDLKHPTSGGATKKKRKQFIFPYKGDILSRLYENHLSLIASYDVKSKALFINNQGNGMTDDMYRYYFNKVKNTFSDKLLSSDDVKYKNYGLHLKSVKWSTHLGRGVFSNMIAEISPNIAYLRQYRGDSTFDAALTYIMDSEQIANLIYENNLDMWEYVANKVNKFLDNEEDL